MSRFRRILSVMMAVILLAGLLPASVSTVEASANDTVYGQIVFGVSEGCTLLGVDGEPLKNSLYVLEGKEGYWYPVGEELEFNIVIDEEYYLQYWAMQTEDYRDNLEYDENTNFYAGMVEEGVNTIVVYADVIPTWEESLFHTIGFASYMAQESERYFDENGKPAEESVFWTVFMTEELDEYMDENWYYNLSYDEYMAIVDLYYVNYPDMKNYLKKHNYIDEETGNIRFYSGGFGDAWSWEALSYYMTEEGHYKIQGLFLNQPVEDKTGMTEFVDYYNDMYIDEALELTLVEDDGYWKVLAYETMDYYIDESGMECELYELSEDDSEGVKTAVAKYNLVSWTAPKGTSFVGADGKALKDSLYQFKNNDNIWYKSDEGFKWEAVADDGYVIFGVDYISLAEMITVGTNGTVNPDRGAVCLEINAGAVIDVDAANAEITVKQGLTSFGSDYVYKAGEAVEFTVEAKDGYTVTGVYWNDAKLEELEYFGCYQINPAYESAVLKVETVKVVTGSTEEVSVTVPGDDASEFEGVKVVVETLDAAELEKTTAILSGEINGALYVKALDIYMEDSTGEVVNMNDVVSEDGKYITFVTDHFSYYALVQKEGSDIFAEADIVRYAGDDRYETALLAASALLEIKGEDKFENIIVASGKNYPDALAGSYLAKVKDAPIILVKKSNESAITDYIKKHLEDDGTVYILGGTSAVSDSFEKALKNVSLNTERLGGATRYETNVAILKEAGVKDEDILLCSGKGYADSLSASAAGLPILLVGKNLVTVQKDFLKTIDSSKVYIIGGNAVISTKVENALKDSGYTGERLAGETRYETSTTVASKFFPTSEKAVLAYARNFPDGLSGSPIAMALHAPIILTDNKKPEFAADYVDKAGVQKLAVLGGTACYTDATIEGILK